MKAWSAVRCAGQAAGLYFSLGVAGGLLGGLGHVWAQGYAGQGHWRLAALALRQGVESGMLVGTSLALLAGCAALLTATWAQRNDAGWTAAVATLVMLAGLIFVLKTGFAARFAELFPAEYAADPGIAPETVFWVFLPPLVRQILLRNPAEHALAVTLIALLTIGGATLIGRVSGFFWRLARPSVKPKTSGRRIWVLAPLIALAVVALLLNTPGKAASDQAHPDVILISIDTLRSDALGCYGADPSPTPRLDDFAKQAARYARAYAPSPWTIPSHAGLLTGWENQRHRAVTMDARLPAKALTLAERLAEAGYRTAAFVNSFMLSPRYGFGQGFDTYVMAPQVPGNEVVKQAETWLSKRGGEPVFLFLHLFDPHWPYGPQKGELAGAEAESFHEFVAAVLEGDDSLRQAWRERYLAEVRRADEAVGNFLEMLRNSDRWDNAWVIVTSDHGEEWWDHGFLGHAVTLYEEVLRVPLLVKKPGQKTGQLVDKMVSLLDVPATLRAQLALPGPDDMDGVDLAQAVENRETMASTAIWGERRFTLIRRCGKGITSHVWRFGRFEGERPDAYFDLCLDPAEQDNLAAGETGRQTLAELWSRAAAMGPLEVVGAPTPSPVVREKLRNLGYMQ